MTVRVTTLKGADAGAYYVERLPSYYLNSGEPAGIWHGAGAALLGLSGEVDDEAFIAVMAGRDPGSGSLLGRRYGDESVRGFDVTASAPKSVSVLFAVADDDTRLEVLAAHDAAVEAMVAWIETHAHTRFRVRGQVVVVDAEGIVAAAFRQHTSRTLDPQLHTHVVVANRVRSPDGRWLALDARTLKLDQRTLSAIYHAGLRAQLTARLGVAWEPPLNGIAEIAHVPAQVLEAFSSRTLDVEDRVAVKLDRFTDTMRRPPTPRERWRLEREAVTDSRPSKPKAADGAELHRRWVEQLIELGHDPEELVVSTTGQVLAREQITRHDVARVAADAMGSLTGKQSTWRPAELVRELAAVIPTDIGLRPRRLVDWLDGLAGEVTARACVELSPPIPTGVALRRDGRPVTEAATDRALTTAAILAEEERVIAWAEHRLTGPGSDATEPASEPAIELGSLSVPQLEAARAVVGIAGLVLVAGAAGTGKTTALAPGVGHLHAAGRVVFGVAPSAAAARVLRSETAMAADTIDKLLVEHRRPGPPQPGYRLPAGATVVVDEAGMVSTPHLAELVALADQQQWRLVLVGDPLQFSAVGRGGLFGHLVDTYGAIELDQVRRFTNDWERAASLRLRRGDPTIATVYDSHGRLRGGTPFEMHTAIVAAWQAARFEGRSVVMMAPTNDIVTDLNIRAQRLRIGAGELGTAAQVTVGAYRVHVGDEVVTRHNQRDLRTNRALMVKNRDTWTVTAISGDGALTVTGETGSVTLPSGYVDEHVELGYAQTSHGAQGRTVDTALFLLDGPVDVRGVYVPMTRGRSTNEAFVVTTDRTPVEVFADALGRDWIDQPAVTRRQQLNPQPAPPRPLSPRPLSPGPLSRLLLRDLFERRHTLTGRIAELDYRIGYSAPALERAIRDRDAKRRELTEAERRLAVAVERLAELDRPLRRRKHRNDIDRLHDQIKREPANIVERSAKLADSEAAVTRLREKVAGLDTLRAERGQLQHQLDRIRTELTVDSNHRIETARLDRGVISVIGPRPDGHATAEWDWAAGLIAQHQAAYGTTVSLTGWHWIGLDTPETTNLDHIRQTLNSFSHQTEQALEHDPPGLSR